MWCCGRCNSAVKAEDTTCGNCGIDFLPQGLCTDDGSLSLARVCCFLVVVVLFAVGVFAHLR